MATQDKTTQTKASVTTFLNSIENPQRKKDAKAIAKIMKEITGKPARMWGASMVGFGEYHYKYASGREGDYMLVGFSPRKQNLTLYIMSGFKEYDGLMKKLGKFKTGKSCLYVNKLDDVDEKVLRRLIKNSLAYMKKTYATK